MRERLARGRSGRRPARPAAGPPRCRPRCRRAAPGPAGSRRSACRTGRARRRSATAASRQPWAMPTQPAATDIRPLASADMAIRKPLPSSPSRAASGTRTPSKVSSAVAWPRSPSLPWISRGSKPGASVGTRNAVMPRWPGPTGAGEDQRDVGPGAVGDEHLRAGEQPVVAVALARGWSGRRRPSRCRARSGRSSPARRRRTAGAASRASARPCRRRRSTWRPARGRPRRCRAPTSHRAPAPP